MQVQGARHETDGYLASMAKGAAGAAAAGGTAGLFLRRTGAIPAAIFATPAGIGAGALGELYERAGLSKTSANLSAGATVAVPAALGVALLASRGGLSHGGLALFGALLAGSVGAIGAGIAGAFTG